MKHLDLCNKILSQGQVDVNEFCSFIADYAIMKGREDALPHIQQIFQLFQSGNFDIIYTIKEYAKLNNKTFMIFKDQNGQIIKQWIES